MSQSLHIHPPAGTRALARREHAHRRATVLAITAILLSSIVPMGLHHLPLDTRTLLAGVDHVGTICLTALHLLLAPTHTVFHLVLVLGALYAAYERISAWRRMRGILGVLDAREPSPGDAMSAAAAAAGLDPKRLRVVDGLPNPAFTVGLLTPRVYVAASLPDRLSGEELAAVLAHEGAHVARRDPLRLAALRGLARLIFWVPTLRWLADDLADEAEVMADDAATERVSPLVLASAILTLATWPEARSLVESGAVGFQRRDLLERRIRRLAGEDPRPVTHVTRRSVMWAAAAMLAVWTSGTVMAHPLPGTLPAAEAHHCDHRGESALAHLFCLGSAFSRTAAECPHGAPGHSEHGAATPS